MPQQYLVAAPATEAKPEAKPMDKSKKVVPDDKPATRGDALSDEDKTNRAKERSTEIQKPPVMDTTIKTGPKSITKENAQTAPEAGEGLKILVKAAEDAQAATKAAAEAAKAAATKVGEAKAEEAKKVLAVVTEMEKTEVVVAKIAERLIALDQSKKVAAVNIPKTGDLRAKYDHALQTLATIQKNAAEQAKVVKELEAEAEEQYGATYNVEKRVTIFPAGLKAKLAVAAGFADIVKGLLEWVKGCFGYAQDAEKSVGAFITAFDVEAKAAGKELVKGGLKAEFKPRPRNNQATDPAAYNAAKARVDAAYAEYLVAYDAATDVGADEDAKERAEAAYAAYIVVLKAMPEHPDAAATDAATDAAVAAHNAAVAIRKAAGFVKANEEDGLSPAMEGQVSAFADAQTEGALAFLKAEQLKTVTEGKTGWDLTEIHEALDEYLMDKWAAEMGMPEDDEDFGGYAQAATMILEKFQATREGGFETAEYPKMDAAKRLEFVVKVKTVLGGLRAKEWHKLSAARIAARLLKSGRITADAMEKEIFEGPGFEIEIMDGSREWLPEGVLGKGKEGTKDALSDFVEGDIKEIKPVQGWWGCYQMPGYLDSTPWCFDVDKKAMEEDLERTYGLEDDDANEGGDEEVKPVAAEVEPEVKAAQRWADFQNMLMARTGLLAADAGIRDQHGFKAKIGTADASEWVTGFIKANKLKDIKN